MSSEKNTLSPLMRQYFEIKKKHPDTILFFQVGDFYELFFEDAQQAAAFLGITLTSRGTSSNGDPIPLAGVPVHVLDQYVAKLIKGGFKVAVCDQVQTPKPGKIVERGVSQVLTPGTLTDSKLMDEKSASYLCTFFPTTHSWCLMFAELLTGQLYITTMPSDSYKLLEAELSRFVPDEIVVPKTKLAQTHVTSLQRLGYALSLEEYEPHAYELTEQAQKWFDKQFGFQDKLLEAKLLEDESCRAALAVLYGYLKRNNERSLEYIKQLFVYHPDDFLMLDAATVRNLELLKNTQDNSSAHTLFALLDHASTAMGSRTIKKWLSRPLIKKESIEQRLDAVAICIEKKEFKDAIRTIMRDIGDLERIVGRIALRRAHIHDYRALAYALSKLPDLESQVQLHVHIQLMQAIVTKITDFSELHTFLSHAINDDTSKDWLVKPGFNNELDRLRLLLEHGAQSVAALETKEQQATGINSLKIRYNGAHGYGIEVTKANTHMVPDRYIRTQTLTNRERYTTPELKDLEYDLMRAEQDINEIEKEVFESIKLHVEQHVNALKKAAQAIAYLDSLQALAHVAYTYNYTRPTFNDTRVITIKNGRHPVIEAQLTHSFIPNDTDLNDAQSLWVITGPNMGGKSTYLRQVALISIMAQMGSFVPAKSANLPLLDRIFTRIGAADNVAAGKSTFLVEMEETALICTQATERSLVILDEVGRGTSTFDGLAIAQAVVEYIYTHVKARCLFATHYHELVQLTTLFSGIASYYAASTKTNDGIVLLHKILPGVADGSFGLEVAKLAQLPQPLISRAHDILQILTKTEQEHQKLYAPAIAHSVPTQTTSYAVEFEQKTRELEQYIKQLEMQQTRSTILLAELDHVDCDQLTAKQALELVWKLKEKV